MGKKITVFANLSKEGVLPVVEEMKEFFSARKDVLNIVNLSSSSKDTLLSVPSSDLAVSLGGDGTVLTCAMLLKGKNIPLLPVKVGTFGYITETQASEYKRVYSLWCDNKIKIQNRLMLDATVIRKGKEVFNVSALNELTLITGQRARISHFLLYIDGLMTAAIRGDGIIIATPTGSTAYNLSAGGPILDALLDAIIINAVCPFSMNIRTLVVGSDKKIEIKVAKISEIFSIIADGHNSFKLMEDDIVNIRKSRYEALLVENPDRKFTEVLRNKLNWG